MIHPEQLIKHVFYPVVEKLGYDKSKERNAVALLALTCAQESLCGLYIRQMVNGPALGIMQMETFTHDDIYDNYLDYRKNEKLNVFDASGIDQKPTSEMLIYNLRYSAAMARVLYRRTPPAIPFYNDIDAQWEIYKKYYNTELGKATREEFEHNSNIVIDYI